MTNATLTAVAADYMHEIDGTEIRHPSLDRCGLFSRHTGLYDRGPIQFEGYLRTGEYVYFKARETKVEMYVLRSHDDLLDADQHLAHYRKQLPFDTGCLPAVVAAQHVINLTRRYIQQRDAGKPTRKFIPKRPKTTDRPVRLAFPKILSEGPEATVVLNFAHHLQCRCRVCVKENVTRLPGRRNGSR